MQTTIDEFTGLVGDYIKVAERLEEALAGKDPGPELAASVTHVRAVAALGKKLNAEIAAGRTAPDTLEGLFREMEWDSAVVVVAP